MVFNHPIGFGSPGWAHHPRKGSGSEPAKHPENPVGSTREPTKTVKNQNPEPTWVGPVTKGTTVFTALSVSSHPGLVGTSLGSAKDAQKPSRIRLAIADVKLESAPKLDQTKPHIPGTMLANRYIRFRTILA